MKSRIIFGSSIKGTLEPFATAALSARFFDYFSQGVRVFTLFIFFSLFLWTGTRTSLGRRLGVIPL